MKKATLTILNIGLLTFLSPIYGNTVSTNITIKDALNKAEAAGYTDIQELKKEKGHYEIEAKNSNGQKMEIKMDMTGNIYKVEEDDD